VDVVLVAGVAVGSLFVLMCNGPHSLHTQITNQVFFINI
jgi:hypothetical protein